MFIKIDPNKIKVRNGYELILTETHKKNKVYDEQFRGLNVSSNLTALFFLELMCQIDWLILIEYRPVKYYFMPRVKGITFIVTSYVHFCSGFLRVFFLVSSMTIIQFSNIIIKSTFI